MYSNYVHKLNNLAGYEYRIGMDIWVPDVVNCWQPDERKDYD